MQPQTLMQLKQEELQIMLGLLSTVLTGDLTASRAMATNGSGKIAVSDVTSTRFKII